jgi:hypothetical protein
VAVGGSGVASPPSAHRLAAVGQLSACCQTPPPDNSATAATTSTVRRYCGMVDGVGGEGRTKKNSGPTHAVAKIDGVKVGGGGEGVIVIMVGGSGNRAESLASPKREVLCRASICFLLMGNYS